MDTFVMQKQEKKTAFNFQLSKELDQQWRSYIAKKYNGYYKGAYTKEIELAIRNLMNEYNGIED